MYLDDHYYVSGGVHDALADADGVNIAELFDGQDLFYWGEVGWSPGVKAAPGDSIHLTFWKQDALPDKGTSESRGMAFSFAPTLYGKYQPFLRVGYSDGDAPLQLTEHLQVTPNLQMTFFPSFNDERNAIFIGSMLRMRLAF